MEASVRSCEEESGVLIIFLRVMGLLLVMRELARRFDLVSFDSFVLVTMY
jgi:hypothetical protein